MGERIGSYVVLRRLGVGPHGAVHEAVDEAIGRRVALRLLEPIPEADAHLHRRFARAAAALASLDSRHLVRVHAHGEHDGRLWVASRWMAGGDLGGLLRRDGPLPAPQAMELVAQVAAGLADAHEVGVVHGALTPASVFVDRHETGVVARLGGFDLARTGDDDQGGVAADVRALGRLLWTVLTGAAPDSEGPVPQLTGTSPRHAAVNRILRATLADEHGPGYSSAARLRDDLVRAATLPHTHRARRSRPRPALATVAALAAGAAAALVVAGSPELESGQSSGTSAAVDERSPTSPRLAVESVARALADGGALPWRRARCTARRWVDTAGIDELVAEGFLDDRMRYVDRPAAAMSDGLRAAAAAATLGCRPPTPS